MNVSVSVAAYFCYFRGEQEKKSCCFLQGYHSFGCILLASLGGLHGFVIMLLFVSDHVWKFIAT